ncbi:MAG: hypothetical protein MR405_08065 [Mollicutes bacterium]|nr:hypothetical protein [Mollicutes bacterium]
MKNREIKKILNFTDDLINIFTDYLYVVNDYFENDKNKEKHVELYQQVRILNNNINNLMIKYGYKEVEEIKENEC